MASRGKATPAKSAVFLIGTVDKPTELGYRAAHGDWLCRSATVFFGSGAFIQPTCLSFERAVDLCK
jgi:hypothetical protein